MDASVLHQILGLFILTQTHFTSGLLSDYKICGDAECESRMSRVQAVQDHYSKDCRFLNFRQGDVIFVYHKLTGKREDLWAGSIDRRFGYFPKAAIKEEEIYATAEKVLETQKSDFFCMNENGYPIDTTEDDGNSDGVDNEPESAHTTPSTLQGSSEESHEISANTKIESEKEGEDPGSNSWLKSSVTGLWELVKKEEPSAILKEDTAKETDESSLTSSVTGWLGLGQKSSEEPVTQDTDTSNIGSSMTQWLNFGSEIKEQDKTDSDNSDEVYRSRKIALDMEENPFHHQEKKDSGTLGWIGDGISSTLGFGSNDQGSTEDSKFAETEKEFDPAARSWFDIGLTDMLGFRKGDVKGKDEKIEDTVEPEQNADDPQNDPEHRDQPEALDHETIIQTTPNTDLKELNKDFDFKTEILGVERGASGRSEPAHTEVETHTSNQDGSTRTEDTVGFEHPKETGEDTAISSDSNSHVINNLQSQHSSAEEKTDSPILECTQNGSTFETATDIESRTRVEELKNSAVIETLESNTQGMHDTPQDQGNQQEMASAVRLINNIQEVLTDTELYLREEDVGMTQDVVDVKEPPNKDNKTPNEDELGQSETQGTQENCDKTEQRQDVVVEIEEWENSEEVVEKESGRKMSQPDEDAFDFVAEGNEGRKVGLIGKGWELDQNTGVSSTEEVMETPEGRSAKTNQVEKVKDLNVTRDGGINLFEAVKEDLHQLEVEEHIIEEKLDHESLEEVKQIFSNNDQVFKNAKERSTEEEKPHLKHTDQNAYENVNELSFNLAMATELNARLADPNEKNIEENTDDKLVHFTKSSLDVDPKEDEIKMIETTEFTASQNIQNEPAASPDHTDKPQSQAEKEGFLHREFHFFANNEEIDFDNEASGAEHEPQVNSDVEEKVGSIAANNSREDSQNISPTTQPAISLRPKATSLNPKTLHKLYRSILTYMDTGEVMILIKCFGEHKMQFLDYVLSSFDTVSAENDVDQSLLLDIERLLSDQMESLTAPRINTQEEATDKTKTINALRKVEIVLEKVKMGFKMGKSEPENNEQVSDKNKEINSDILGVQGEAVEIHTDTEGVTGQTVENALTQIHAALKIITWITVKVRGLMMCHYEA
ncbi:unnamed protein product [Knipowitschia caucasica]